MILDVRHITSSVHQANVRDVRHITSSVQQAISLLSSIPRSQYNRPMCLMLCLPRGRHNSQDDSRYPAYHAGGTPDWNVLDVRHTTREAQQATKRARKKHKEILDRCFVFVYTGAMILYTEKEALPLNSRVRHVTDYSDCSLKEPMEAVKTIEFTQLRYVGKP